MSNRVGNAELQGKITTAEQAAAMVEDGMTVATSGFTPAGYPKAIPLALAKRAEREELTIDLFTGASVGQELDGELTKAGIIRRRIPYQANRELQAAINKGNVNFIDLHLSHMAQMIRYGFLGKIDLAIIEAAGITQQGELILSTSVGNTPTFIQAAERVMIEINTSQPLELEGIHDIYIPFDPPNREPIPIMKPQDRIGSPYVTLNPGKVSAVVFTDIVDKVPPFPEPDEACKGIGTHLAEFLKEEKKAGRIPENYLPFQSGVGTVANGVLQGLQGLGAEGLSFFSEVIQDSVLSLIDANVLAFASGTSLTLSPRGTEHFYRNLHNYRQKIILRPQEISNNPEVIRRLGVISVNTAVEVDIFGNVNSTHVGSRMLNGIGGSGDFARNAYLTIFVTPSVLRGGQISCLVPRVSHVDHTEHDVDVIITEQGVADLRGLAPRERTHTLVENCCHPDFRLQLKEKIVQGEKQGGHTPYIK